MSAAGAAGVAGAAGSVGTAAAAGGAGAPRRRRTLLGPETYELVFGTVYTGLMTNLLLAVACLPLVVLVVATDLATTWPLAALAAPLLGPALVAAFAVFGAFSADGSTTVVRTFARAWRRHLRRGLAIGALATGALVVAAVDVAFFWGRTAGAAAIPVLVTLAVVAVLTALLALAAVPEMPGARLRDLLLAALVLGVRRWYLSAGALVVLGLLAGVVATRPAVGLGFAAAPLLFAVWGVCRFVLRAAPPAPTPPR
ncbi:ferredoxin-NADPH reductase [Promicromonospora sp. NPDC019610]|uniref:ferredoxin-NADPH reductase n=1 Tax=Promicromonospora sp. NPDC019610 TaxID=3364405 RepID=UPI00379EB287